MMAFGSASAGSRHASEVSASHESRHPRVSLKTSESPHNGRRRKGTDGSATDDGPMAGDERVGGTTGPHHGRVNHHVPAATSAASQPVARWARRDARIAHSAKVPCLHEPVAVERGFGGDVEPISLTSCDGRPATRALEQLSIVARPMNAPKPALLATPIRHVEHEREWLPGVKLIHEGLVTRLQSVVDHFHAKKVTVVSGYRPASLGSFHQSARAMDFHLDGVSNEALVAYCRSLPDTGCGYYPNSSFVHMDVRAPRTGHVYWIDASGPGEPAHYVATWPLRDTPARSEIARPDPAAPLDEHTHPDAMTRIGYQSDINLDARAAGSVNTQEDPFTP